jgi:SAM-dependent methyltransferase
MQEQRGGLNEIETLELDLDEADLPQAAADGAWCRWVLSFVKRPRDLLTRLAGALRPGGALVLHEYFDYATWRVTRGSPEVGAAFVGVRGLQIDEIMFQYLNRQCVWDPITDSSRICD